MPYRVRTWIEAKNLELSQYFATWHPVFVHFPIALLFAAVGLDIYGYLRKDDRARWAGNAVLILGTVGVLFTFITGNFAEIWAARSMIPQDPLKRHESFAMCVHGVGMMVLQASASPHHCSVVQVLQ